ncbi:MAG: hypothetical protein ACOCUD_04205 [Bacillota bacterium]
MKFFKKKKTVKLIVKDWTLSKKIIKNPKKFALWKLLCAQNQPQSPKLIKEVKA